jgi:transposase, IS5 family
LIDASIIEAPRQRLTIGEKQRIRAGERPDWPVAKARHKDTEARLGGLLTAAPLEIGSSVC